jgi:hypothetical protein
VVLIPELNLKIVNITFAGEKPLKSYVVKSVRYEDLILCTQSIGSRSLLLYSDADADDTLPLESAATVKRHPESKISIPTNTQKRSDRCGNDVAIVLSIADLLSRGCANQEA